MPQSNLARWLSTALLCALSATAFAAPAAPHADQVKAASAVPAKHFKALDLERLEREDSFNDAIDGVPKRFAVAHAVDYTPANSGSWSMAADRSEIWRLRIRADGAVHLNFGFERIALPAGAQLWVYAIDGKEALGPYQHEQILAHGQLWTPVLAAEEALLQLSVPAGARKAVDLRLTHVGHGYRGFGHRSKVCKSGSCNTDVACLALDDPWNDPVRSVGAYTVRGTDTCTGSLINNSAGDKRMLFATATHCQVEDDADAASMVVYWRYESPTCRTPGSSASGIALPKPADRTTQGLRFLAATPDPFFNPSSIATENSDFTLVELASPPVDNDFELYWSGWDRRPPPAACAQPADPASTAGLCASIHHPGVDEKRITFVQSPMPVGSIDAASGVHFTANWDPTPPLLPGIVDFSGTLPPSVTEPGSSGSPLYNADRRLIGVLSGGASFCGAGPEDLNDEYGGLFHAWEGLGTSETRMRDHLDPLGLAPLQLDGIAGCEAPTVQLAISESPGGGFGMLSAGQDVVLRASVSGGVAPYEYRWDIDGDGVIDRSALGLDSLSVRYPSPGLVNARLRVVDASGCGRSAGISLDIGGPELIGSFGTPVQLCGDGDGQIDPGERWRLPLRLDNTGTAGANDVRALIGKEALGGATQGGPDAFGYTFQDSSSPVCSYQFIDLDPLAEALQLVPAGEGFPAEDDGRSVFLALGDFAFEAYGQLIESVALGTNGYLTADPAATGEDFGSSCGVDPDGDAGAFRLNVLHDDLITAGGLRSQTFDVCPRPADVGSAGQRCVVFQWSGMGGFQSGGIPDGDVDFQAVVYPDSRQIVHQYRDNLNDDNADADISLYRGPGSPRLTYSCDSAVPLAERAVCFFHPGNQPNAADPEALRLLTPVPAQSVIGAAQIAALDVDFELSADAACGSRYQLAHRGSTFRGGFSPGDGRFELTLAEGAQCNVVPDCGSPPAAEVDLNDGAFFAPDRPGNGLVSHVIPRGQPGLPAQFFGMWFTGENDRQSSWLVVQGDLLENQVRAPILRFVRDMSSPTWSVSSSTVGQAEVTLLDANQLAFSWRLGDQWHAEILDQLFVTNGTEPGTPDRTGAWFWPPESGWGLTVDSYRQNNVEQDFTLVYLYDDDGQPRWTLTQQPTADTGLLPALMAEVHCPGCAWLDINPTLQVVGSLQRRYDSPLQGNLSMDVVFPAPLPGSWQRSDIPIVILTLPRP
jgi:hypothetical protein